MYFKLTKVNLDELLLERPKASPKTSRALQQINHGGKLRRSHIRTHFKRIMCVAYFLSPNRKILSDTCEVA